MSLTDIAEVKAALEPFAKEADRYDPDEGDDGQFAWANSGGVTIGMLRRAREALAALSRMERSAAPEGRHWRHMTSGMFVSEIGRGRMQTAEPIGDMTPVVIYHHAGEHGGGGTFWVRPVREFEDGRFVELLLAETGGKP
jgi:hypothetical protein